MKTLKCNNCGANMNISDENKDYAVCEYCGAKTKLSDDINVNINVDEDIKKGLKMGGKIIAGISIANIAVFILVFILIIGTFGFIIFKGISAVNKNILEDQQVSEMPEIDSNEVKDNVVNKYEIDRFNSTYELFSGTKSKFFLETLLDDIVTNNKKNKEHQIIVIYKKTNTNNPDKIVKLKHSLKNGNYEVSLDYDDNGFVYKVTLKDVK